MCVCLCVSVGECACAWTCECVCVDVFGRGCVWVSQCLCLLVWLWLGSLSLPLFPPLSISLMLFPSLLIWEWGQGQSTLLVELRGTDAFLWQTLRSVKPRAEVERQASRQGPRLGAVGPVFFRGRTASTPGGRKFLRGNTQRETRLWVPGTWLSYAELPPKTRQSEVK